MGAELDALRAQLSSLERRAAELEAALEESRRTERRLTALLDATTVGVRCIGAEAREHDEGIELIHPDDHAEFLAGWRRALERPRPWDARYRMRRPDGSYAHMLARNVPLLDQDGVLSEWVCALSDMTGEHERQQLQERLQRADRMVSIGTLASGVAHEMNTPLAYVASNLSYAIEVLSSPAVRKAATLDDVLEALEDARQGGDRIRHIVGNLLSHVRVDNAIRAPVRVEQILEFSIQMAQEEIRRRARLRRSIEPDCPPVLGNEGGLSQVFLNLLVNAAHAIPEEPDEEQQRHEIVVSLCRSADGVCVEVRDTGAGIPPEMLPRIFDPFFTTKPEGEGTGLGLYICHSIVTSLGGAIEVESEAGRGSCFRVLLPACEPGADPSRLRADPAP